MDGCSDSQYDFKYWTPELLVFEDVDDIRTNNVRSAPMGYEECLFEFVSESNLEFEFWTEKTVRPILCRKPFLIYAHPNANLGLKQFGFEVFDEVFDYEFDSLPDFESRFKGAYDQIMQYDSLTDDELMDMYRLLKPKIEHNFEVLKNMPERFPLPEEAQLGYPELVRDHNTAFTVHYTDKY